MRRRRTLRTEYTLRHLYPQDDAEPTFKHIFNNQIKKEKSKMEQLYGVYKSQLKQQTKIKKAA